MVIEDAHRPDDRAEWIQFGEVERLLDALPKRERLERQRLALALAPVLRDRYGDLREAALETVLVHGLCRLWREVAGSVPLALAQRKMLEKYFTLMVCYLYPAQHGQHRFLISSDRMVQRVPSFGERATRLGEPEYLALIYADGDLDQAREVLDLHLEVFKALSESTDDGLPVHPHPNTVNSRRKVAIRLLASKIAELLDEGDPEGPEVLGTFAKGFQAAIRQGQTTADLAQMVDQALAELEPGLQAGLARPLAGQLAAIRLGLEPGSLETRTLAPANVQLALRRLDPGLTPGASQPLLDGLVAAGLLTAQGETYDFVSLEVLEWFGAEFVASYAGHRFLPEPRHQRVMRRCAELLALRGDDARNDLLVTDILNALPHLHAASLLDVLVILEAFGERETPGVCRLREAIVPEVQRLAAIPGGHLQRVLGDLGPSLGTAPDGDDGDDWVEDPLPDEVVEQAREEVALDDLLVALSLPEALARDPRWTSSRAAVAALLGQVRSPSEAGLALACAAWLRSAPSTLTLEIKAGLTWPFVKRVTVVDELLRLSQDEALSSWPRRLALTVLAGEGHLTELLGTASPTAHGRVTSLLWQTNRRAAWDEGAGQWTLLG